MSQFLRWVTIAGGGVLFILMLLTAVDVIGRYVFNRPIVWGHELSELLMVFPVFLGMAYVAVTGRNITIEFVADRLPVKARGILGVVNGFLALAITGLMVWQVILKAQVSWQSGEATTILHTPIYPFQLVIAFALFLLLVVLAFQLSSSVRQIISRRRQQ